MDAHLRDLRYFVAVAEELNFTRAAERLHISQPALSKQIRGLETSLHAQLFLRDRRQVSLTAAGEALLDVARPLLDHWDEGAAAVAAKARTLRVCMTARALPACWSATSARHSSRSGGAGTTRATRSCLSPTRAPTRLRRSGAAS